MKNFDLGRPIRDGKELTEEDALKAIDERELLSFEVIEEDGVKTEFKMIADPSLVTAQMVQDYQNAVTRLALRGEYLDRTGKRLQAESGFGGETNDDEEDVEGASETVDPSDTSDLEPSPELADKAAGILSEAQALQLHLKIAKANLLAPAIEQWNVPGIERPTPDYLIRRTGAGPAALLALGEWFFPTTPVAAAETGTNPTPNTDSTSATSQPTPEEENTPPIS